MISTAHIDGVVAPGFESVRIEFARNFAERGEIGAAVAVCWHGEKVVDLWGGRRIPEGDAPWNQDTMVAVQSATKGLSAMTLAIANARGWLDYDAPVARYWPEFAQHGKAGITVRQLLGHEAGLVVLDETLTIGKLRDLDSLARVLARQKPAWSPGTRQGYHTIPPRALHAGAHSARRPGAAHARPLLPRRHRRAARPRVLHRAAAGDSRRPPRERQDLVSLARPPRAAVPSGLPGNSRRPVRVRILRKWPRCQ